MRANNMGMTLGKIFLVIGCLLLLIKGLLGDYVDEAGMLHEHFFLLPIAYVFLIGGILCFVYVEIRKFMS